VVELKTVNDLGVVKPMPRIEVIIIGCGHAGLAMSCCLNRHNIPHVVFERGRIAERWRSERWDSLRLLTPNFLSRLPGWCYQGENPDGFMGVSEFISFLEAYAYSFDAPVYTGVNVESVERSIDGFLVRAQSQIWETRAVVIATGHCDTPFVPVVAESLSADILQLVPSQYHNPNQLPPGGVLVVGAGASGVQIAEELADAGQSVTISVSRHRRRPRRYRNRDILWWVEQMGIFRQAANPHSERSFPAPQLVGSDEGRSIDLGTLQKRGVKLIGRVTTIDTYLIRFDSNLEQTVRQADQEMHELLASIDSYADANGHGGSVVIPESISLQSAPTEIDLQRNNIRTVLWATGYRRTYPWLHLNLLDKHGELRHCGGVTEEPGIYVIGLRRQRRNNSNFIDGVGDDALFLSNHLNNYLSLL
jgi:putative flavoprotein involved in K+ transport